MDVSCGGFMGLLKCMSFGHLVSEWLFMMLNFTSVLTNVVMVVRVRKLVWVDDESSFMWLNDSGVLVWVQASVVGLTEFVSMAHFSVMVAKFMSKFMMFWSKMGEPCLPFLSMSEAVLSVSKAVLSVSEAMLSMLKTMVNSGVIPSVLPSGSMQTKFMVWHRHVVVWLSVDVVLNSMVRSTEGFVWCIHVLTVLSFESMVIPHTIRLLLGSSFLVVGFGILKLSSESGLVLVWSQLMVSVGLIEVHFLMMNWAVLWHVWVMVIFEVTDVVWCCISVMVWGSGVNAGFMAPELLVVWSFMVWGFVLEVKV
jgi:hypothetical protein